MAAAGESLVAQPLRAEGAFNWIYLIDWIVIGVLSLFFLFYFNRLFATVVSYCIRLYTWRTFRVYIDIEALQFSPLAGRLFFKGIRYHGDNETVFVHSGNVTWRYWLPKTKTARIFQKEGALKDDDAMKREPKDEEADEKQERNIESELGLGGSLPCRVSVKVSGIEAFIYNRGPAYDFIVEGIRNREESVKRGSTHDANIQDGKKQSLHGLHRANTHGPSSSENDKLRKAPNSFSDDSPLRWQQSANSRPSSDMGGWQNENVYSKRLQPPALLRLLPIHVECQKAAAVLGNDNTSSIISAKVESAHGEFDASQSGPLDVFKILMGFEVAQPYIQMKPNVDYRETQLTQTTEIKRHEEQEELEVGETKPSKPGRMSGLFNLPHWASNSLESVTVRPDKTGRVSGLPFTQFGRHRQDQWQGLARYLGDDEPDEWHDIEYAKSSVIADLDLVGFQFYWDIAGPVPELRESSHDLEARDEACDINTAIPPAYGMRLIVQGGYVTYGPWADRNRLVLQQIFFPTQYADAVPTTPLEVGKPRLCTVFKLDLHVSEDTVLRIPFREPSKDHSWQGRASALARQSVANNLNKKSRSRKHSSSNNNKGSGVKAADVRPFAWFDIRIKPGTSVHFKQDMFPRKAGYINELNVDVSSVEIYSSLNHALLWRSRNTGVKADLSYPLAWNGLRDWTFNLDIHHLDFFLLRDHTFLLVDLIEDWSRGPLPDFFTFIPFRYKLNVHFQDFKLYLNTNDANIIDDSEDLDENEFIILYGRTVDAVLDIPLTRFRPAEAAITFDVNATDLGFEMCMPPKNTLSDLLANKNVATLPSVDLHGSYTYCSEVKRGLTETLLMEIIGRGLEIQFYGFLGRHLAKIKENYFGETVHFRTLEEYQELVRNNFEGADHNQPAINGNDLDVVLDITAEDVNILLPAGLYDADEYVKVHVDDAAVDLRVNNYYLELMVNSYPIELSFKARTPSESLRNTAQYISSGTQLLIDNVAVSGHRLFGLPPSEPAYVSNWDIDAGSITGECQPLFFEKLMAAGQSAVLSVQDHENAVPVPHSFTIHDSTFVRFGCPGLKVWCPVDRLVLLLSTGSIKGNFNDLAGRLFSQRLNMAVPDLLIGCYDATGSVRRYNEKKLAETFAHIKTNFNMTMVQRHLNFRQDRELQQQHLSDSDAHRGLRATFLYNDRSATPAGASATISLPLPTLPPPLTREPSTLRTVNPVAPFKHAATQDLTHPQPDASATNETHLQLPSSLSAMSSERCQSNQQLPLSSIPLSSPFKLPSLTFEELKPDLSDVPNLSRVVSDPSSQPSGRDGRLEFSDDIDDDTVHTTVLLRSEPGIAAFCDAEAVRSVAGLVKDILPKDPSQLLDALHIRTVMEVLATNSHAAGNNSITDVSLHLPRLHARFVNSFAVGNESDEQRSDRYNVVAAKLGLALRIKQVPLRKNEADATSVHATLSRLTINAFEGSSKLDQEGAALESHVDDILVWLNISDCTSVNASFRKFEAALASQKVEYLANLIHRTTMLGDELQRRFSAIIEEQDNRLQYLAFVLTDLGEQVPDPRFLTRPSYVIRSSQEHVRNSDFWKILSRWHYVLRMLSHEQRRDISDRCRRLEFTLHSDAESATLAKLDSWRAWDAIRVRECYVIRIVYASTADVERIHDRSRIPIDVSLRAGLVKLAIDPGPSETSFSLERLVCGVAISPPPPQSAMQLFQEYNGVKSNGIQLKLAELSMRVDWNVHRLVDQVLTLFENTAPQPVEAREVDRDATDIAAFETFHIVFCSDKTQVDIVTINASQELVIIDLKTSVVGTGWANPNGSVSANVTTSAKALGFRVSGHEKDLLKLEVVSPVLWIAYDKFVAAEGISNLVKVAGDSKEITVKTSNEIIDLLEVAHALIADEVAKLQALVQHHKDFGSHVVPKRDPVQRRNPLQIDLALFLNIYTIQVALLSDLAYFTTGKTIRLAVTPKASINNAYHVDFDLKAQTHSLLYRGNAGTSSVPQLQMPAINGSLDLTMRSTSLEVSAMLSIEKIAFEGAALYGIGSILGSQATVDGFKAIKAGIVSIRRLLAQQTRPERPRKASVGSSGKRSLASPALRFDLCVALAGLAVSADAPPARPSAASINLLFDIQSIHFRSGNRSDNGNGGDGPLPFPSFKLGIQEVSAELREIEHGQLTLAGRLVLNVLLTCTAEHQADASFQRRFALSLTGPIVDIGPLTGPLLVEMLGHMQSRMRNMDPSTKKRYLRRLRHVDENIPKTSMSDSKQSSDSSDESAGSQVTTSLAFELRSMRLSYVIGDDDPSKQNARELHDLILSLEAIELVTRSQAEAKLNLRNLQLALKPVSDSSNARPATSALMPDVAFHVGHKATKTERKLLFQAAGKALDVQLDPQFLLPLSDIERSLTLTSTRTRGAIKRLNLAPRASTGVDHKRLFGERNLSSLVVDADFAGAVVRLRPSGGNARRTTLAASRSQRGRYGQFAGEEGTSAVLRAPGIKLKVEYADPADRDPTLNVELRINASSNELSPSVVPLMLQVSDSVKKIVRDDKEDMESEPQADSEEVESNAPSAYFDPEQTLVKADPKALLGKTQLNVGIRICKQQFSLSCQPIAKVAASARLDDIYITINNIDSEINNDHFFAASATFKGLNATLQHVYSRTITFSFDIESIFLSIMNSKHISGSSGISAILKINPTRTQLNAKQLQDLLLFREIWFPLEMRNANKAMAATSSSHEPQDYFMHRYQQIAASTAFSWNATISIAELIFDLDLGQSIGKISSKLSNLWINSSKSSRARQNLCIGIDGVDISSSGRLSGFVDLDQVRIRTSIAWPDGEQTSKAPLIQGAVGFGRLCVKAAFDYQAFAVADVTAFEFIMYNVRDSSQKTGDRLVAILDGDKVNVYCIASSAALGFSLYQAFERLTQEKKTSFEQSLHDIETFLRRRSTIAAGPRTASAVAAAMSKKDKDITRTPNALHTDVVVTLRSVDVGAFPSTLLDQQILRFEASDVQARFAAVQEQERLHSGLGLTLGQLRVALASTPDASMPKTLGEITIEEVVKNAHSARGGVVLRVPKVVAAMQTWQKPDTNTIEYIFRSSFEGKIDVGWNYSRISFIRGMYNTHTRTLATRLGKPLPEPAVKVKGAPDASSESTDATQIADEAPSTVTSTAKDILEKVTSDSSSFNTLPRPPGAQNKQDSATSSTIAPPTPPSSSFQSTSKQQKITIEPATSLPESKYTYIPLEAPIIETPQLRDMGEATPPLEWVGLNREKLPNATHQVVILALLGVAREVEEAYLRVLGGA